MTGRTALRGEPENIQALKVPSQWPVIPPGKAMASEFSLSTRKGVEPRLTSFYRDYKRYIPQDTTVYNHRCGGVKSHGIKLWFKIWKSTLRRVGRGLHEEREM